MAEKKKKKGEDDLVDAGSEYSFPASDPPSYMGGSAVTGPPPREEPAREPVNATVSNPAEVKPVCDDAPQGADQAKTGQPPSWPSEGKNKP